MYHKDRQAQQRLGGGFFWSVFLFSSCLILHLSAARGGVEEPPLINIARNTQLPAACAADSPRGAMREHPFRLPRILGDVCFILKTKANGFGGDDPQSSLHPCHPSFPSEWLKPSATERF